MRVALPLGGTDWGGSGIGVYVRSIVPHLAESLRSSSDSLFVFGNRRDLEAYSNCLEGIEQVAIPGVFDKPALSAAWYLTYGPRFAQVHGAKVLLYPAAQRRYGLIKSIPTVAVVHDLGQLKLANKYDPLRMAYFKYLMLPLLKHATRLVAISGATRDDLASALELPKGSIRVVSNGVDCSRFQPLSPSAPQVALAREVAGISQPYILYPARLEHPAKNHLRLIEAYSRSTLRNSHLLALSGGDWGARERILRAIDEHGVAGRVRILGFLPDDAIPGLVAGADAIVMVGLTEGFGLPALEALACGRPVCAARAGALPEVVGTLAAFCDPMDVASITAALERTIDDQSLRQLSAEEGPAWARARSWNRTGAELADVCREVGR